MLHSYVTDMAARVTPTIQIPIFAPILLTEPENHDQTIHRVPVNEFIVILMFYG